MIITESGPPIPGKAPTGIKLEKPVIITVQWAVNSKEGFGVLEKQAAKMTVSEKSIVKKINHGVRSGESFYYADYKRSDA